MRKSLLLFIFWGAIVLLPLQAQELIPLENWRTHFSYNAIQAIEASPSRVYAASTNGLFYVDKATGETEILSELNGLSEAGIAALQYDEVNQQLFIGYRSGLIDVMNAQGKISPLRLLTESPLGGERRLYSLHLAESILYIGFDAGIALLDTRTLEPKGSWLNLGEGGNRQAIVRMQVFQDSIFAIAGSQLIATSRAKAVNQADFANWKRFDETDGLPAVGAKGFAVTNNQLWVGFSNGLYTQNNGWERMLSIPGLTALGNSDSLLYASSQNIITVFDPITDQSSQLSNELFRQLQVLEVDAPQVWIGDGQTGLLRWQGRNAFERFSPDGPVSDRVSKLVAEAGQLIALYGQAEASLPPEEVQAGFSVFSAGQWQNYTPFTFPELPAASNLLGAAYRQADQAWYFASFGDGLLRWQAEKNAFARWQAGEAGVSLQATLYGTLLSDVAVAADGRVWMINYGASTPLHRFNPQENSWQGFFTNQSSLLDPQELLMPASGDAWITTSANSGILVANPEKQPALRRLTETPNEGGLSDNAVRVMEEDLDGSIWVGTEAGVVYLPTSFGVLGSGTVNAIRPVFRDRFLLRDEAITALAVDGGNRKWIGTRNGLFAFGDFGDTLNYRFTTENSPLPSNEIRSLAVNQQTGEVFVATARGLVSFRSASSLGSATHASAIQVFPNPVRLPFEGKVGIAGLVRDATVKITDVAGRLVRELAAEGGTASWDVRDAEGRLVPAGVYLIFSANFDGTETLAGKLAVIR